MAASPFISTQHISVDAWGQAGSSTYVSALTFRFLLTLKVLIEP